MPQLHLDLRQAAGQRLAATLRCLPLSRRLRLSLPAWTPGSYLIRDYVRQLEGLRVIQAGQALHCRRVDLASWEVELPQAGPVTVHYTVVATELSVRTCHLSDEHGFLALAAVALAVEGERWSEYRLGLQLPEGWQAFVPLPLDDGGLWRAAGFDQLVDTPVEVGPHRCHHFAVAGLPHRWVTWGRTLEGDDPVTADPDLLAAVARICQTCCRIMGEEQPAAASDGAGQGYLFVLHLTDAGYGGLEHDHSSVLQFGRRRLATAEGRRKLLQLVAHEYLHQWNVRRLRPAELTPYRYDGPVPVPSLWFAEGVTSYLDLLIPHAAGLSSEAEVLEDLGADLSRYLLSPGRRVQSLRDSSEEAWVKLYKPDAHSPNSQISYYLKGAVLALVLDLRLRRHGSCLVDVLRELWLQFGAVGRGYQEHDLIAAFVRRCPDLETLLPTWLTKHEDPPLHELLADIGLRLQPEADSQSWLGWELEIRDAALVVRRVWRDGPAEQAGVGVGDELLALNGLRLRRPEDLETVLAAERPLHPHRLLTSRDGRLLERQLQPEPPRPRRWQLCIDADADASCGDRRAAWLAQISPP